jgi:DNA-binding transcriptional regulator YhcF (GntR family)
MLKEKLVKGVDKPYDMVMSCVKHDMRISADAFRLWMTLYTGADDWYPTRIALATQFGVKLRTMQYWLKELRHYGYLTIQGTKGNYTWIVHKYSKGVVDVDIQGARFCTLKNINKDTNVQNTTPIYVQEITPIIKTIAAPQREQQRLPTMVDEIPREMTDEEIKELSDSFPF